MGECAFCQLAGDPSFQSIYSDDDVMAFDDIKPQAPIHFLVIPRQHIDSIAAVTNDHLLGSMFEVAHRVARERKVFETGYRLVFNSGSDAGQSVDHVHLHVLGGRQLAWPPG